MNPNRERQKTEIKEKIERKPRASPEILEANYRKNVAHAVNRIEEWTAKLDKLLNSRKHHLTVEEKAKVEAAVGMIYETAKQSFAPTASEAKKGFSL